MSSDLIDARRNEYLVLRVFFLGTRQYRKLK